MRLRRRPRKLNVLFLEIFDLRFHLPEENVQLSGLFVGFLDDLPLLIEASGLGKNMLGKDIQAIDIDLCLSNKVIKLAKMAFGFGDFDFDFFR